MILEEVKLREAGSCTVSRMYLPHLIGVYVVMVCRTCMRLPSCLQLPARGCGRNQSLATLVLPNASEAFVSIKRVVFRLVTVDLHAL